MRLSPPPPLWLGAVEGLERSADDLLLLADALELLRLSPPLPLWLGAVEGLERSADALLDPRLLVGTPLE